MKDTSTLLLGRTRSAVLALLYGHPDEAFYLRQIARLTGAALGGVQRELPLLARAGLVRSFRQGRELFYQADEACSVFHELKGLLAKTAGAATLIRQALTPLAGRIRVAMIIGSVARGEQRRGSDIDLVVIGDVKFTELLAALGPAQRQLYREINPVVYPSAEFRQKLAQKHTFVTASVRGPRIFLIGSEHELRELARQPLDRSA